MFRNVLIFIIVVALALAALRFVRRPKRLFEIRVGEQDVTVLGPVPNKNQSDVRSFVNEMRLPLGARIVGVARGNDYRISFSKGIRQDDRERLRSFIREG